MFDQGIIKTLNHLQGYGFITPEKGRELFFHVSGCVRGFSELTVGDQVQYRIVGQGKKRRAIEVSRLGVS